MNNCSYVKRSEAHFNEHLFTKREIPFFNNEQMFTYYFSSVFKNEHLFSISAAMPI